MKHFLFFLGVALALGSIPAARACKYCEMAAADPEARLSAQVGSQSFPLEGVINQYQPAPPAANLQSPPSTVATKATDLPATSVRRAVPPPAPAPVAKVSAPAPARSGHWADAGLVSLAAAGGVFYWRTRRRGRPRVLMLFGRKSVAKAAPVLGGEDGVPFTLAVLNPAGRDPEQHFPAGAGQPEMPGAPHPPINFHATPPAQAGRSIPASIPRCSRIDRSCCCCGGI